MQYSALSWTILCTVNDGFFVLFQNWLAHYEQLAMKNNVYVVAEDDIVHGKLTQVVLQHSTTSLVIERTNYTLAIKPLTYFSREYRAMVSTRAHHILRHLQANRNVLYTDVDSVWLSDPTPWLATSTDVTLFVDLAQGERVPATAMKSHHRGQASPVVDYCTGFMAMQANDRTRLLVTRWGQELAKAVQPNQPVFNKIALRTAIAAGLSHTALPRWAFPNGAHYFERFNATQRKAVVVVHNNFIHGLESKIQRFISAGLWLNGTMGPRVAPNGKLSDDAIAQLNASSIYLGSQYGGFSCLPQLLHSGSLVYSIGIGTDLSFDAALIAATAQHVHGFDNTPVSNKWFASLMAGEKLKGPWLVSRDQLQLLRSKFHRHPFVLGASDGDVQMKLPTGFVTSFANMNVASSRGFKPRTNMWIAPARKLTTLMHLLNHTGQLIDLLKLDVEAAEFGVIHSWREAFVASEQMPQVCQLVIEFHARLHPDGAVEKVRAINDLTYLGFQLVRVDYQASFEGDNAFFINPNACSRDSLGRISGAKPDGSNTRDPPSGSPFKEEDSAPKSTLSVDDSSLSVSKCTDLLKSRVVASFWKASQHHRRRTRFNELRRQPHDSPCWEHEGHAAFFQRAASGAACANTSWFHYTNDTVEAEQQSAELRISHMPALLGFLDDTTALCTDGKVKSHSSLVKQHSSTPLYQRLANACQTKAFNILMLWRNGAKPWNMCTNYEWLLCGALGKLPQQRGNNIVFATAPATLRADDLAAKMDQESFDGSLVFYVEVCVLAYICENGADLFARAGNANDPFECARNASRLESLHELILGTDAFFRSS